MSSEVDLGFKGWPTPNIGGENYLDRLKPYIREGNVIPIISNSLRDDRYMAMFKRDDVLATIMRENGVDRPLADELSVNISRLLARVRGYPLPDDDDLARVLQYLQVKAASPEEAKRYYLKFLKDFMVLWAKRSDPQARAIIQDENLERALEKRPYDLSHSDLLNKFGYPLETNGIQDPLRLLAKLDLPIYITTSYYETLEQALVAENKRPRTQVCTWAGQSSRIDKKYWPDPVPIDDPEQAIKEPLVFHLFGLERFPHTLALSVDDYLNFLVNIFLSEGQAKTSQSSGAPLPIPPYLWEKIADLQLLLLGYQLQNWDFKALFRGLITAKPGTVGREKGVVIQLEPDTKRGVDNPDDVRRYLKDYFTSGVSFQVQFGTPDAFIAELYRTVRDS